jgi:hypothetical protein
MMHIFQLHRYLLLVTSFAIIQLLLIVGQISGETPDFPPSPTITKPAIALKTIKAGRALSSYEWLHKDESASLSYSSDDLERSFYVVDVMKGSRISTDLLFTKLENDDQHGLLTIPLKNIGNNLIRESLFDGYFLKPISLGFLVKSRPDFVLPIFFHSYTQYDQIVMYTSVKFALEFGLAYPSMMSLGYAGFSNGSSSYFEIFDKDLALEQGELNDLVHKFAEAEKPKKAEYYQKYLILEKKVHPMKMLMPSEVLESLYESLLAKYEPRNYKIYMSKKDLVSY